ncbi:hypothetical protein GRI89_12995 [Altererythrobacter salegens]|uniref:Uncharacterized protein n=1 Tax=Croceibacterium salegens TaxID=1737568 RepID=A0A6I4SWQ1_9SPHN|nr:hypothetical protein [Croceibacterium salegens]MXO60455.1 hypothetical protein [Croceibacterium salegens]
METLNALAERACLCQMAGRDASAVTRRFEELTAGLTVEGYGTASDPLSSEITCFPQIGEEACVVERIEVVGNPARNFVCTNEQADELEATWHNALAAGGDAAKADFALLDHLQEMRDALANELPQSDCAQPPQDGP